MKIVTYHLAPGLGHLQCTSPLLLYKKNFCSLTPLVTKPLGGGHNHKALRSSSFVRSLHQEESRGQAASLDSSIAQHHEGQAASSQHQTTLYFSVDQAVSHAKQNKKQRTRTTPLGGGGRCVSQGSLPGFSKRFYVKIII